MAVVGYGDGKPECARRRGRRLLKNALPAGELEQVRVEETENNFFEYSGE